jgi:hypothetical protein
MFIDLIVIAVLSIISVSGAHIIARGSLVSKVERAFERRIEQKYNDIYTVAPKNNKVVAYKFD